MIEHNPEQEQVAKQYDLALLRAEMNSQFSTVNSQMQQVLANTSSVVTKDEHERLKQDLELKIDEFKQDLELKIKTVDKEYAPLKKNITKLLWAMVTTILGSVGAIAVAVFGDKLI